MTTTTEPPTVPLDRSALDSQGLIPLWQLLVHLGLETCNSNARRVVAQGGVWFVEGIPGPDNPAAVVGVTDGMVVRVGKRKAARVQLVDAVRPAAGR
jgi:tyrosyl-tRNA synthetase